MMPTRQATENPPTAITVGSTSAVPLTPRIYTSGLLQTDFLPHIGASPSLPLGNPSQLSPPGHSIPAPYTGVHPQSIGAIPSDTTEWDPTMVSPARRDPSYNPAASTTALRNTAWDSSPASYKQRQGVSTSSNGVSLKEEIPALGVFPALGLGLQLTQLRPIPLKISPQRTLAARVITNTNSTDTVNRPNQEPLGKDIPATLPSSLSRMKRIKRSSTSAQQVNTDLPIAPARSYQLQTLDTSKAQPVRKRVIPTTYKRLKRASTGVQKPRANIEVSSIDERENDVTTIYHKEVTVQHPQQPDNPSVLTAGSTPSLQNSSTSQAGQRIKASIGRSWASAQLPEQLNRKKQEDLETEKYWEQFQQEALNPIIQNTNGFCNLGRMALPEYVECIPEVLTPRIVSTSPTSSILDTASTPISVETQFRTNVDQPYIIDATNPNFEIFRPGTETPEIYDDPSWDFDMLNSLQRPYNVEGFISEFETPINPYKILRAEGNASGATPTSYSQCLGSPNSLICMYRANIDVMSNYKRRGMSLLHTKKAYIGESALLNLDMPETGETMGIEAMEALMDELIGGELEKTTMLDSVEKDREIGGLCMNVLEYVQWG